MALAFVELSSVICELRMPETRHKLPFMPLARKIVLHSPVSDEADLERFVERCLAENVSLVVIYGPGSDELEEKIDWLVVGDGSDPNRFLCTTSHPEDPIEDVLNIAKGWESELGGAVEEVRL